MTASTTPRFRRHLGKCPACKRTVSVLAAFVGYVGEGAFPGYERRLTRGGVSVDATFVSPEGTTLPGSTNGRTVAFECDCTVPKHGVGMLIDLAAVQGILKPEHKCDARCLAGKGHTCECACGGKNHGASYAV